MTRPLHVEINLYLEQGRGSKVVKQGGLRWFGHLVRLKKDDWVSACRDKIVLDAPHVEMSLYSIQFNNF